MNTTKALPESDPTGTERPSSPASDRVPAGTPSDSPPARWPTGAKALVGFLVLLLVGAVVAAIALVAGGESTEDELNDEVATLEQERDEARSAADELDDELATAMADNSELTDRVEELNGAVAELEREAELQAGDLTAASEQVTTLTAERDALAEQFPIRFDTSLADVDLVGDHELDLNEVLCQGLTSCGMLPSIDEITVSRTAEGWLRLTIPDYAEGGLLRADGALQMVVASTTALPACDGVERSAKVAMTLLPGTYEIAADGAIEVATVGAVLTFDAPAIGECPAALAYDSGELSPAT